MDWEERYRALEAKYKSLEGKYNSLNEEHLALLEEHNFVQEQLDAHSQLAEDLEEELEDEQATRKKTTLRYQRERQKSISIHNMLSAGQDEIKQKEKKLREIEVALSQAKLEGEEGKKKALDLEKQKEVADKDLGVLRTTLDDKTDHLQLLKEQQMYYEEEISEYARLAKSTKRQIVILQGENRRLRPHAQRKRSKKKNGAATTLDTIQKNKEVMNRMKKFMEEAMGPSSRGEEETEEEREKRKIIIHVITRMLILQNGYSATDPFEKRMWLKLKKNMLFVTEEMKKEKPRRRRNSKTGRPRRNSRAGSASPGRQRRGSLKKNMSSPKTKRRNSLRNRLT